MDSRGSYEKLSIRDSARSLKKYGSTSKHVTRTENCLKHYVTQSDTLQGIALRYNVTIEQIRRLNRLWASDSLFLKEYLLIPSTNSENMDFNSDSSTPRSSTSSIQSTPVVSPTQTTASGTTSRGSFDDDNISDFLSKIDQSIASTKEVVQKSSKNSCFATGTDLDPLDIGRRRPAVSRMKQLNNNTTEHQHHSVVVQQGKKVRTSIKHHEKQQDELFEL